MPARECSRTACSQPAVSTLTFVYEDSTAVVGPLSRTSEPHTYDLCRMHAARLTAPLGWELLRIAGDSSASDDLVALSDAVHRAPSAPVEPAAGAPPRRTDSAPRSAGPGRAGSGPSGSGVERHLRVVRTPHE
ncbi:DUF3499 domain-containing protein [Brachybacterium sp. DNPG3]